MRVAIVHDWLYVLGGAEKVLRGMLRCFPDAELFCLFDVLPAADRARIGYRESQTSFLQKMPFINRRHRLYLPLMPLAIEQLDLSAYDLVLSSSYAVAKGVLTGPDQLHISYVHSPMRYAWDLQHQYLKESGMDRGIGTWIARSLLHRMRLWDVRTAHGVDEYVANSRFIARRIAKLYGRSAEVIHPPVAVDTTFRPVEKEDFFLTASRLVPYKNIRAIVEAFALLPKARLVVAGDGPEMGRLKAVAGSNVTFTGFVPDPELRRLMATARAFVFAAEEDFGITPVEAQACGTPVIAWRRGGVRETVVADGEHRTGLFFDEATADGIADAIHRFHRIEDRVRPQDCHRNALRFSEDRFNENFGRFARERFEQFSASMAAATCRSEPVAAPMLAVRELAAERRSSLGAV